MSCGLAPGNTAAAAAALPPLFGGGQRRSPPPSLHIRRDRSFLRCRAAASGGGAATAAVEKEEDLRSFKSFYDLLGISEHEENREEIKRAYKRMARIYHPDVCPSPERTEEYTRRFIEVQQAYETLSDPNSRAIYDRHLARGLHLAFSSRRTHVDFEQDLDRRSEWRDRWQDQLGQLKRRSAEKDSGDNLSWGARMRRQRDESLNNSI